jgi:hypothetical protein
MSLLSFIVLPQKEVYVRNHLIGLGLGVVIILGVMVSQAALACSTQTLIVGGKLTVCTVCGTVVSCM